MGSSSEDFGWTGTSNDDSDSDIEMPYEGESESGNSYKKKLQKELFQNGGREEPADEARRRNKHKKREREAASPSPARVKRESLANGHEDSLDAERLLKIKVKEENSSFALPRDSPRKRRASTAEPEPDLAPFKKKKKKRDRSRTEGHESSTTELDGCDSPRKKHRHKTEDQESSINESHEGLTDSPRKKKKRKRSERDSIDEKKVVIDKFEAEETVVERRPKINGHRESKPGNQTYPSKEFIEDDDSSDDERPPPAGPRPRVSGSDAKSPRRPSGSDAKTESPRKGRVSERITFDTESHSESESQKSQESSERARALDRQRRAERTSESDQVTRRLSFSENSKHHSRKTSAQSESDRMSTEEARPARRASERITFESSESEAPPAAASPRAAAGRLGRFLRAHAHLRPVLGEFPAGAAVAADDDVWLLRCPGDVDARALLGATLALDERGKLKVGGRAFDTAPAAAGERAALLGPAARGKGFSVRAVPLLGAIRLRARIPRTRAAPATDDASPERIPLPETKLRHPLLGADYEAAGSLPPDVRRRLAAAAPARDEPDAVQPSEERGKKKKKKHKERAEPEPERSPEPEPEPKKRKRKHSSRPDTDRAEPDPSESQRDPDSPPRRKKKKKEKKEKRENEKRRDDSAVWDSERGIEESLFNF